MTTEKRENGEPSVATAIGLKAPGCAKTPASSPEAVRPRVKRLVAKGQIMSNRHAGIVALLWT